MRRSFAVDTGFDYNDRRVHFLTLFTVSPCSMSHHAFLVSLCRILMGSTIRKRKMYEEFLSRVSILGTSEMAPGIFAAFLLRRPSNNYHSFHENAIFAFLPGLVQARESSEFPPPCTSIPV